MAQQPEQLQQPQIQPGFTLTHLLLGGIALLLFLNYWRSDPTTIENNNANRFFSDPEPKKRHSGIHVKGDLTVSDGVVAGRSATINGHRHESGIFVKGGMTMDGVRIPTTFDEDGPFANDDMVSYDDRIIVQRGNQLVTVKTDRKSAMVLQGHLFVGGKEVTDDDPRIIEVRDIGPRRRV